MKLALCMIFFAIAAVNAVGPYQPSYLGKPRANILPIYKPQPQPLWNPKPTLAPYKPLILKSKPTLPPYKPLIIKPQPLPLKIKVIPAAPARRNIIIKPSLSKAQQSGAYIPWSA